MKISILLPYKENFSPLYPGAVSLFINSMNKLSIYKKEITVYGSTHLKEKFSDNYINIQLKKSFLKSQTRDYVNKFVELHKNQNTDIIEIHNRPNYVEFLKPLNSKKVLYNSYKNSHKSVENNYAPFVNSYLDYNSKTKQNIHIRFTENMVGLFNTTYDTDVDQDESQEMGSVS